jgi:hypothetical protein
LYRLAAQYDSRESRTHDHTIFHTPPLIGGDGNGKTDTAKTQTLSGLAKPLLPVPRRDVRYDDDRGNGDGRALVYG